MQIDRHVIKRLRESYPLTKTELAERAKTDRNVIRNIETGKTNPRPATVRAIAAALGVDVAELWMRESA
jgi:transcriptional regulator with XRE-family HTH domain